MSVEFTLNGKTVSVDVDADTLLLEVLRKVAFEHKHTPMIGRSHGIHAEPITFGLVCANWYAEARRNLERLKTARTDI